MESVYEEEATFYKPSGSIYVRIPVTMSKYVDIESSEGNNVVSDLKIAMGISKHGKFLYLYSPLQQEEYKKMKKEEQLEEVQQQGGE